MKGFLAVSYESKPSQAARHGALLLRLDATAAPRSGGVDDAAGGFRSEGAAATDGDGWIHGASSREVVVETPPFFTQKMVGWLPFFGR